MIQHGVDGSSVNWVINGDDKTLTYMLANQGFDVWLGNTRGSRFSREHLTLTADQEEFWDWSFQEMGEFDVPANIKTIL